MTDEEFNRYCAKVMNHVPTEWDTLWDPATDLNQMAKVFDKLVSKTVVNCHIPDAPENLLFSQLSISMVTEGIAQAMREFIESTGEI